MKRMILLAAAIAAYAVYQFIDLFAGGEPAKPAAAAAIYLSNVFCAIMLLGAYSLYHKVTIIGSQKAEAADEDERQIRMERYAYQFADYAQIAFTVILITLVAGFLLLRHDHPGTLLFTFALLIAGYFTQMLHVKLLMYVRPGFQMPLPEDKNFQEKLFDSFDDGEKHVMLKGLYKLYSMTISAMIVLLFVLMFYSIFSGESQLFSIIAVGALLLFMQLFYLNSLKTYKRQA
ncbi:DUF3169 family protein [Paenibacillus tarimensis]|uniref:DUF3169 family protein n=1 Tax=Paenibacillus tarimensis TaxID=416012 RepID=UPI001F3A341D|nr:DUF3169 family protein [Paenibacillus tarimensis]MCF2944072.1 DUF3169 family protein [Paenibacillus tarimensis]